MSLLALGLSVKGILTSAVTRMGRCSGTSTGILDPPCAAARARSRLSWSLGMVLLYHTAGDDLVDLLRKTPDATLPRPKEYGISNVPKDGDPRWGDWSRPVQEFIQVPRTWDELDQWAAVTGCPAFRLRHCLAWLDNRKLAGTFRGDDGEIRWTTNLLRLGGGEDVPHRHDTKK